MEVMKKLEALKNSETFEQELAMVNTAEEMQQLFKNHGVELSLEEVEALVAHAEKASGDELSAEDLDDVAGGSLRTDIGRIILRWIWIWVYRNGRRIRVRVRK